VKQQQSCRLETTGLSAAGLWVRRQTEIPSLAEEALCLSELMQTWDLSTYMSIDGVASSYAEVSRPGLDPAWIYLLEVTGRRNGGCVLLESHPLSQADPDEPVRLLALLGSPELLVLGALVETPTRRRMLWLQGL
jgi:hypothetical protein